MSDSVREKVALLPEIEITFSPNTLGQAVYWQAVVIPEIENVLRRYATDLSELGKVD